MEKKPTSLEFLVDEEALKLADKIYKLKKKDPNIISVDYSYGRYYKHPEGKFLILDVEMENPFKSEEDFRKYLVKHKFPYENIVVENSNPFICAFYTPPSPKTHFLARFYEKEKLEK